MIKHETALDASGKVVCISDALKSTDYFCRGCGAPMIAKLGSINAHHFAHVSDCANHNYQPESEDHYKTKIAISTADFSFHKRLIEAKLNTVGVTVQGIKTECRIAEYVADVLVQTDAGDFAFEVVNSHYSTLEKRRELGNNLIEYSCSEWNEMLYGDLLNAIEIKEKWNLIIRRMNLFNSISTRMILLFCLRRRNDEMFHLFCDDIDGFKIRSSDEFKKRLEELLEHAKREHDKEISQNAEYHAKEIRNQIRIQRERQIFNRRHTFQRIKKPVNVEIPGFMAEI